MKKFVISESDVRTSLIRVAEDFSSATGMSLSAIGIASVGDSKFLARVRNGSGFNIKTYQRVMDWIEAEQSKEAAE
ncbi:hypothetical protein MRBLMR1_004847 [Neorhizobium sp. LMR1-1-1.1]